MTVPSSCNASTLFLEPPSKVSKCDTGAAPLLRLIDAVMIFASEDSEKQMSWGVGDVTEQYVYLRAGSSPSRRDRIEHGGQVKTAWGDIA